MNRSFRNTKYDLIFQFSFCSSQVLGPSPSPPSEDYQTESVYALAKISENVYDLNYREDIAKLNEGKQL